MANAGEHHFEAAQLSASRPWLMLVAAAADRVVEGRDCFHTERPAPSPGDRSAGLAAEAWLLGSRF